MGEVRPICDASTLAGLSDERCAWAPPPRDAPANRRRCRRCRRAGRTLAGGDAQRGACGPKVEPQALVGVAAIAVSLSAETTRRSSPWLRSSPRRELHRRTR